MAWNAVTDVNDGQSYGGAAWQSGIDAVTQIQGVLGPDETDLQARRPKRFFDDGSAAVGFTVEGTIAAITVPAQTVAGFLFVWGLCFATKTVADDTYRVRIRDTNLAGAQLAVHESRSALSVTGTPSCSLATVAGVAKTIAMTVQVAGTGSGTVFLDSTANRIDGLWIATP